MLRYMDIIETDELDLGLSFFERSGSNGIVGAIGRQDGDEEAPCPIRARSLPTLPTRDETPSR